ncbi:MAG: heme exporter protein CcmB [Oceanococcus sp.]
MNGISSLLMRELQRYWLRRGDALQAPLVFCLVCLLFPLGGVPSPEHLARYAPAVIWAGALTACVFGLETLYRQELQEGWVDSMLLSPWPMPIAVFIKGLVHWIFTGLPVVALAWPMSAALYFPEHALPELLLGLLLGTPVLVLLGGIGAGLTAGLGRGGLLTSLLMFPLYIPVLIFGAGCAVASHDGLPATAQLYLLACMLVLAIALAPWASSAALKIASESS